MWTSYKDNPYGAYDYRYGIVLYISVRAAKYLNVILLLLLVLGV